MTSLTAEKRNTHWPKFGDTYEHFMAWGIAASWRVTNTSKLLFVTLDPSCDVPEGISRGMVSMEFAPSWLNEDKCPVGTAVNLELVKPADRRFEDGIARFVSIREDQEPVMPSEPIQRLSNTLPVITYEAQPVTEKMVISGVNKALKCAFVGRCIALQKGKAAALEEAIQAWLAAN